MEKENTLFWRRRKAEKEQEENNLDIEKYRFRFRSRSRDFCQFLEGFGIAYGEIGLGKKVSVLVLGNLVSEKSIGFGFEKFGLGKKVLVLVSKNLVSEKNCLVSVSVKILVSSFSGTDNAIIAKLS